MIILGCDPGFANFGWCLAHYQGGDSLRIDSMGVIETRPSGKRKTQSESNAKRCAQIGAKLHGLTASADAVCVEAMSYPRNAMSAHKMGLAWGVLSVVCNDRELPVIQVTPQDIKEKATGTRSASKDYIQEVLVAMYPESKELIERYPSGKREHMVDALGAIHASLDSDIIRMGVKR